MSSNPNPQRKFEVTKTARAELRKVADGRELGPGRYLRLAVPPAWTGEGDFGIVIDSRGPGDVSIPYEGRPVLLIERDVADQLWRSVLDFKAPPEGRGFTLDVY